MSVSVWSLRRVALGAEQLRAEEAHERCDGRHLYDEAGDRRLRADGKASAFYCDGRADCSIAC